MAAEPAGSTRSFGHAHAGGYDARIPPSMLPKPSLAAFPRGRWLAPYPLFSGLSSHLNFSFLPQTWLICSRLGFL